MQGPKRWRVTNVAGFLETLITAAALALAEGIPRGVEVEETEAEGMVPERELSADVLGWTFPYLTYRGRVLLQSYMPSQRG